jgi:hypothetical protein
LAGDPVLVHFLPDGLLLLFFLAVLPFGWQSMLSAAYRAQPFDNHSSF